MADLSLRHRAKEGVHDRHVKIDYFESLIIDIVGKNEGCNIAQVCKFMFKKTGDGDYVVRRAIARLRDKGALESERESNSTSLRLLGGKDSVEEVEDVSKFITDTIERYMKMLRIIRRKKGNAIKMKTDATALALNELKDK